MNPFLLGSLTTPLFHSCKTVSSLYIIKFLFSTAIPFFPVENRVLGHNLSPTEALQKEKRAILKPYDLRITLLLSF